MSPDSTSRQPVARLLTGAFVVAACGALYGAHQTGLRLLTALAGLSAWAAARALAAELPPLRYRGRTLLTALGGVLALLAPLRLLLGPAGPGGGVTDSSLQLVTVALAIGAFVLHFLGIYATQVPDAPASADLGSLIPFARLLAFTHGFVVLVLILRLYTRHNALVVAEGALVAITLFLAGETCFLSLLRHYQPARRRTESTLPSPSPVLCALFGHPDPLRSLSSTLERTFGTRLEEARLVRLGRSLAAPLTLLFVLGLWASTAVTQVPVDSRGVLVSCGAFSPQALPPGLVWHAPWPWARVERVQTEPVREIALGFERDLAGPILWTEKHYEGEQNLLVGQGQELLTLHVPIHYRVRDAVAYLRHTTDATTALATLGYRELMLLATRHTAFGFMTTDRDAIAAAFRRQLQSACDRHDLGLEIVFAGLKDVHPPVAVAAAYQDVISAEEERRAMNDEARTEAVNVLSAARSAEVTTRISAEAQATTRRHRAAGEASRFLAPLPAYLAHPDAYRARLRLESWERALADLRSLVVVPAGQRTFYLNPDPTLLTR
ncbi:MAG: protease modulator HflK [Opitutaceae bacterium]|jgi:membrane protease subunit HflK|nr:protease modulator HflK [Opitutaceae bacterium]